MTDKHKFLKLLEQRILWLSCWMIHNANHIRENSDGLKVGGHQASSASIVSIMTALYFIILNFPNIIKLSQAKEDKVLKLWQGLQTKENIENFRGFGGAQSYPSRTKDIDDVDISSIGDGRSCNDKFYVINSRLYFKKTI